MPYIKAEHRLDYIGDVKELGMLVKLHADDLKLSPSDERCATAYNSVMIRLGDTIKKYHSTVDEKLRPGHLNYVLTTIIHSVYGPKMRYYDHNEVIGVLAILKTGLKPVQPGCSKGEHLQELFNRLLLEVYGSKIGGNGMLEIFGALTCCSLEFYRRSTAVYEDICITNNGDVTP